MFRKLLIANRGEIACRIARTGRRLGIALATVHSHADRDALHVREIGESVCLGPAPARDSYLRIDRVIDAARRVGADAVHPGYGFLAEQAAFADACAEAGLVFVGPHARTLREFGDKASAKRLARAAGVPVIAGSDSASDDPAAVARAARAAGFPLVLKAAAGGGGKGMRVVDRDDALDEAIASAMREARSAFGDGALLVERHLAGGRHVEVQILGDGTGHVIHLWERECSLQRRHQKLVEEAPVAALAPAVREAMRGAAIALGRAVAYRALGTVEFLVCGDAFHFLEVNPRLQVEHPVTEAITGLDLVEWQLRAVAGQGIPAQDEVRCDGHAFEARVCAEDPERDFAPASGRVLDVRFPSDARVDAGVARGSVVPPDYDTMIAKVVVHAADRRSALARLGAALADTRLVGIRHNLALLRALAAAPEVAQARADTGWVERHLRERPLAPAAPGWFARARWIAAAIAYEARFADGPDARAVGHRRRYAGWRLHASDDPGEPAWPHWPTYRVQGDEAIAQAAYVAVDRDDPERLHVRIEGVVHRVRAGRLPCDGDARGQAGLACELALEVDDERWTLWCARSGDTLTLCDADAEAIVRVSASLRPGGAATARGTEALVAPLMGRVVEVRAAAGDVVDEDAVLVVIESMKMELRVAAPHGGRVSAVHCAPGATVARGATLVELEAAGTSSASVSAGTSSASVSAAPAAGARARDAFDM